MNLVHGLVHQCQRKYSRMVVIGYGILESRREVWTGALTVRYELIVCIYWKIAMP